MHDRGKRAIRPEANAERHLKGRCRRWHAYSHAIPKPSPARSRSRAALRFSPGSRCAMNIRTEPVPAGRTPQQHLEDLHGPACEAGAIPMACRQRCKTLHRQGARRSSPGWTTPRYFLTVYDIVRFAREPRHPLPGPRLAPPTAPSAIASASRPSIPPKIDLLFERFISAERREPPDIDVDFEHERREEVIQYLYERYNRDRAAICSTRNPLPSAHGDPRGRQRRRASRKDVTAALAGTCGAMETEGDPDRHIREAGLDPAQPAAPAGHVSHPR